MAFPTDVLGVLVELALGADLTEEPATWAWTDITDYVRYAPGIEITTGRRDETSESQPSECVLVLDNTSGRFTPRNPASPYYPNVKFNTPLRVRIDPGTGYTTRFIGFTDSWPLRWDISGNERHVEVTASGILRRLNQGRNQTRSALYREIISRDPIAYWPLEDGDQAVQAASAIGGQPMRGTLAFGQIDGPPGSDPVLDITNRGQLAAPVPGIFSEATWRVEFIARVPADDASTSGGVILLEWATPGSSGDITYWRVTATTAGTIFFTHFLYGSAAGTDIVVADDPFDGRWRHYQVDGSTAAGSTDVIVYIDGIQVQSDTIAADGYGPRTVKVITAASTADDCLPGIGHIAVWDSHPFSQTTSAWNGWAGEDYADRLDRVCDEEDVFYAATFATGTQALGPQPSGSLLDVLRDIEQADGGLLYDATGGIAYRSRYGRYNQDVALALDYEQGHIQHPLEANDDDQNTCNDATAQRPDGSPYRYTDTSGAFGTTAVGWYSDSLTVNVETDLDAEQRAAWRVGLGTVDELRFPQVNLDFASSPDIVANWLAVTVGERITISNPPAELPPSDPDLQVLGWTEYISPHVWTASLNTVPNRPYQVIELDGADNISRLDAESSAVFLDVDDNDTAIRVYNTAGTEELWTTDDEPFDIGIAGERITVTAVTTNPATFVAAGTAAHGNNASVSPGLPAGIQAGDLLLVLAAIRTTSGSVGTPSGWSTVIESGNVKLLAKKAGASESAPTVTFTGGAAGDDTSAQMCAFRNAYLPLLGGQTQTNTSAQNINFPGRGIDRDNTLIVYIGWKQDDWTSVTSPGTEIGEPDTTTGNDQGLVWSYTIQTTATDVVGGSFTVTGGASAVSKAGVVQFPALTQTMTVTRSVNGVTKSQAAGASVRLWQPHVLAL